MYVHVHVCTYMYISLVPSLSARRIFIAYSTVSDTRKGWVRGYMYIHLHVYYALSLSPTLT